MKSPETSKPVGLKSLDGFKSIDTLLALIWGVSMTLCVTGYTFGQSNHHVYLLDALYAQHPENLRNDWFTTHTLQYHVLYTWLVVALQKVHLLKAGFFTLYLGLAIAMHASWWSIVRQIGGDLRAYMISVLIYHLAAGGLGLGVYQFLQDGSFLPSNISAIAAMAALAYWMDRRLMPAAICVGISGLFHLNYSLVLVGAWGLFTILHVQRNRSELSNYPIGLFALATVIAMTPCLINVANAARSALSQTAKIPIDDFVQLYVKLRHPHHYDAMSWPIALWVSFLLPIPFALFAIHKIARTVPRERLAQALFTSLAIQLFAVTFAGIWFVSETIIQMSLFRFSIFAKLISCILMGWLIAGSSSRMRSLCTGLICCAGVGLLIATDFRDRMPASIPLPSSGLLFGAGALSLVLGAMLLHENARKIARWVPLLALPATIYFAASQRLGVAMPGEADASMIAMSRWARDHTPIDSLFLVPPSDSVFRLEAQRSAVVGFKHVPQLSGELIEWKRRLDRVLDCNILTLPRPMPKTLAAMDEHYAGLSREHFQSVCVEFQCDYVISLKEIAGWSDRMVHATADGKYWLYRVRDGL